MKKFLTIEDEDLILKEICMRMPFGVVCVADLDEEFDGEVVGKAVGVDLVARRVRLKGIVTLYGVEKVRPVLRRMDGPEDYLSCLKRHVDVNGMIGRGLAVPAEKVVSYFNADKWEEDNIKTI